jgi:phage terminase small subunit
MPGTKGRSGGSRKLGADRSSPDSGPVMPFGLTEAVQAKWREIVSQIPGGVLRRIDCHQIKLLAELLAGADDLSRQIQADPQNDRARRLFLQSIDRIQRLSALFGLSPADRMRLKIEAEETKGDDDPLVQWMKRGGLN